MPLQKKIYYQNIENLLEVYDAASVYKIQSALNLQECSLNVSGKHIIILNAWLSDSRNLFLSHDHY